MSHKFDDSQQEVLDSRSNFCVVAGAGSGKTGTLVEYIVRFIEGDPVNNSIVNVLAMTFSEKAASEMRERVAGSILNRLRAARDVGDDKLRQVWERELRRLAQAEISTIHSYCLGLITTYSHLLGLPSDIDVNPSDDPIRGHLPEIVTDLLHERQEDLFFLSKTIPLSSFRFGGSLTDWIVSCLNRISAWGLPSVGPALSTDENLSLPNVLAYFRKTVRDVLNYVVSPAYDVVKYPDGVDAIKYLSNVVCRAESDDLRSAAMMLNEYYAQKNIFSLWRTRETKQYHQDLNQAAQWLEDGVAALEAPEFTESLARLVNIINSRLKDYRFSRSLLSFDDILSQARALLKGHSQVRSEQSRKWRLILVDEFQDTNRLQADIISQLLCDPLNPAEDFSSVDWRNTAPRLKVVGDPKQSIYRFRGSEPSIMNNLAVDLKAAGGEHITLDTNYRTQKPLIEAFNALFEGYLTEEYTIQKSKRDSLYSPKPIAWLNGADDERPRARYLDPQVQAGFLVDYLKILFSGEAGIHIGEKSPAGDVSRLPAPGDVAVLLRQKTNSHIYQDALTAAGWSCHTLKGGELFEFPEIAGLAAAYLYLRGRDLDYNLHAVLSSPLGPVSDETLTSLAWPEAPEGVRKGLSHYFKDKSQLWPESIEPSDLVVLNEVRELLLTLKPFASLRPPGEIIEAIVEERHLLPLLISGDEGSTERVRNVQYFMSVIKDIPLSSPSEPFSAADEIMELWKSGLSKGEDDVEGDEELPEQGSINIMTVHKSKGLEFPIVVIAEADRAPQTRTDGLIISEEGNVAIKFYSNTLGKKVEPPEYKKLKEIESEFALAENKRLFYVAATRARDHLVVIGKQFKNPTASWLSYLTDKKQCEPFVEKHLWTSRIAGYRSGEQSAASEESISSNEKSIDEKPINKKSIKGRSINENRIDPLQKTELSAQINQQTQINQPAQIKPPSQINPSAQINQPTQINPLLILPPPENRALSMTVTIYSRFYVNLKQGATFKQAMENALSAQYQQDHVASGSVGPQGPTNPIDRGNIFHAVMEASDFSLTEALYEDLVDRQAAILNLKPTYQEISFLASKAMAFQNSSIGQDLIETLLAGDSFVRREWPFWLRLPSDEFDNGPITLSGTMDLFFINKEGVGRVVDYKLAKASRNEAYEKQIQLYRLAIEKAGFKGEIKSDLWFCGA
ncbi:MAG: UvrD-helicase domain-containing protein [Deltaproteobacteria bacterium]|jgi:ATP-dependent exoDNAse (exonuclease V) beta subunit|nr:UvrD-helicase domain-containing protein [Deltaproteobacteria bacterium]